MGASGVVFAGVGAAGVAGVAVGMGAVAFSPSRVDERKLNALDVPCVPRIAS